MPPFADASSSVPPEILIPIFEAAMDLDSSAEAISQVCSRWRGLALQTPHLWTHIKIASHTHPKRVTTYLHRSKSCHFDLSFEIAPCSHNGHICPVTEGIIGILLSHSSRWRMLSLSGKNVFSILPLISLSAAPRLEELSLTLDNTSGDLSLEPMVSWLFYQVPVPPPNHLKTFSLAIFDAHERHAVPFRHIDSLLQVSPWLEKISLHGCYIGSLEVNRPLHAPSLRSFSLHHHHKPQPLRFETQTSWLLRLNAPNLHSLELGDIHLSDWLFVGEAIGAIPQTFSGLRKLRLQVDATVDALAVAKAFLPNLEEFKVVPTMHAVIFPDDYIYKLIRDFVVALLITTAAGVVLAFLDK
ncbi:hypothetical protein ONZ45_g8337 [Pleurotus djamor]|nr:hypothetical protein ONZ45_g8337 [Pleurotus djamor]